MANMTEMAPQGRESGEKPEGLRLTEAYVSQCIEPGIFKTICARTGLQDRIQPVARLSGLRHEAE